ncbi:MAG: hypothetical protein PHO70_01570 [Candidatus Omnitrophica bacterium]|nr:hypothetical protein [Candidatus Omnitrophota bacterium]
MRSKTLLYGVNFKCRQCVGKCKQWQQIIIVYCPMFESILADKSDGLPSEHEKLVAELQGKRNLVKTSTNSIFFTDIGSKHKKEIKHRFKE